MVIDAHTHVGFSGAIVASPAELVASMKKAGIGKALVFAGELNGCSTARLLGALSPYEGTLYPVGSITPGSRTRPTPAQVDGWLRKKKIYGLKFYPGYEYFYPYEKGLRPYLKVLAEHGRPAIFHSGDTYSRVHSAKLKYAQPLHIDDIATDMPTLPIVVAHLGYPWQVDAAELVYKNKNVYADCSGFVYGPFAPRHRAHFRDVLREFIRIAGGTERLLFGSDWPISDQTSYVRVVRSLLGRRAGAVLSGNAMKLFGLDS